MYSHINTRAFRRFVPAFLFTFSLLFVLACSGGGGGGGAADDGGSSYPAPDAELFAYIEGGTFTMGSPANEIGHENEEEQHPATVSSFYMGKYEITLAEYEALMGSHANQFMGDDLPVETVSWYEAVEYCNARSEQEGLLPVYSINKTQKDPNNISQDQNDTLRWTVTINAGANGYRLPTEAEWEYAARAGSSKAYSMGDSITPADANYANNNNGTMAVGSFAPNAWDLYDMHGNVAEWVWDWYVYDYELLPKIDPKGAMSGYYRVFKGGGYSSTAKNARAAARDMYEQYPSETFAYVGFRIVRGSIDPIVIEPITYIANQADLANMANNLDGDYVLTADITLSGDWMPIGNEVMPFTGTFDGKGHKISNLTITSAHGEIGLFGHVKGASIKNIGIENVNISARAYTMGGIAGYAEDSSISKCYTTGNMTSQPYYAEMYDNGVGGIVGYATHSQISNSYSSVNIEATGGDYSGVSVGGVLGVARDYNPTTVTISNVYSTGTLAYNSTGTTIVSAYVASILGSVNGNGYDAGSTAELKACVAASGGITIDVQSAILNDVKAAKIANGAGVSFQNSMLLDTISVTGDTFENVADSSTAKTAAALKTQATYEAIGWKFGNDDANPWKMPANGGYPILYWQ